MKRICGKVAAAISASMRGPVPHDVRRISMFDWPEQIHTSPLKTSSITIVFDP